MKSIDKIDKNLAINDVKEDDQIVFRNVLNPSFNVYGLIEQTPFVRIPVDIANITSDGVAHLNYNTSGGRVRFKTDSKQIVIKAIMPQKCLMPHMPFVGSSGFDMYEFENETYQFLGSFIPDIKRDNVFQSSRTFEEVKMRDITINLPLYDNVQELQIGLQSDAIIQSAEKYRNNQPIIYYGSSITQGGCASRPGNCYPAMISRRFNCDYINLGFSGNAKGEQYMADYIASQPMSLFFMDYDHNAPNCEYLDKTHEKFFLSIREKNPVLPIIITCKTDPPMILSSENILDKRRNIIETTYENALRRGDKNTYYIDGGDVFKLAERLNTSADSCTVDGCHPNDLGFSLMAKVFGDKIGSVLGWI